MDELLIFTDGSVDNKSGIGYGACLIVSEPGCSIETLSEQVKVKRFEDTSSTKLELQTLLWALKNIFPAECKVIVHTDSQNIMSLPARRARFEQNDYRSKKNRLLKNHELYRDFFQITDRLSCDFIKVRGHKVSHEKDDVDRIFTLVDKASRNAMRGDMG